MEIPPFIDLRALDARLGNQAQFRPLKRHIRRAMLAQSCTADLSQAGDLLTLLDGMAEILGPDPHSAKNAIQGALLTNAVLLYARATAGNQGQGERGSISINAQLTEEQEADHQAIVRVRHRALAHVYPDEPLADDVAWHSELTFAVATEAGWKPGVASNRIQVAPAMLARLRRQNPIARQIMYDKFQERMAQLTELLNTFPIDVEIWVECFFDPVATFGSELAVAQLLKGMESGMASFQTES